MYHLTFFEGLYERKHYYYHNKENALQLQRDLLIIEINNLISEETEHDHLNFLYFVLNGELQKLLDILIELAYKDDYDRFLIKIEIEEIKFQDDVKIEDDELMVIV